MKKNSIWKRLELFLRELYPNSVMATDIYILTNSITKIITKIYLISIKDFDSGIIINSIAIDNLDIQMSNYISEKSWDFFIKLNEWIIIERSWVKWITDISSNDLSISPMLNLYIWTLNCRKEEIMSAFNNCNKKVKILPEEEIYKKVFISYWWPDLEIAKQINTKLKEKWVKTWFFPESAVPWDKLHRIMFEWIEKNDKVLLICSKNSLNRSWILNEIERVLEKEAREWGINMFIPITLDNYIFDWWNPVNFDIKTQITSRVIVKIWNDLDKEIVNILLALK